MFMTNFLQITNLLILAGWAVLAIITLFQLRSNDLPATAKAIWAVVILCVPILGAVAYFIVNPKAEVDPQAEE